MYHIFLTMTLLLCGVHAKASDPIDALAISLKAIAEAKISLKEKIALGEIEPEVSANENPKETLKTLRNWLRESVYTKQIKDYPGEIFANAKAAAKTLYDTMPKDLNANWFINPRQVEAYKTGNMSAKEHFNKNTYLENLIRATEELHKKKEELKLKFQKGDPSGDLIKKLTETIATIKNTKDSAIKNINLKFPLANFFKYFDEIKTRADEIKKAPQTPEKLKLLFDAINTLVKEKLDKVKDPNLIKFKEAKTMFDLCDQLDKEKKELEDLVKEKTALKDLNNAKHFILALFRLITRLSPAHVARLSQNCVVWGIDDHEKEELILNTLRYAVIQVESYCNNPQKITYSEGLCQDIEAACSIIIALNGYLSTERTETPFVKTIEELTARLIKVLSNSFYKTELGKCVGINFAIASIKRDKNRVWCSVAKKILRTEDGKYYRKKFSSLEQKIILTKQPDQYNPNPPEVPCNTDVTKLSPNQLPYRKETRCDWLEIQEAINELSTKKDPLAQEKLLADVVTKVNTLLSFTFDQSDSVCPLCFSIDDDVVKLTKEYLEKQTTNPFIDKAIRGLKILQDITKINSFHFDEITKKVNGKKLKDKNNSPLKEPGIIFTMLDGKKRKYSDKNIKFKNYNELDLSSEEDISISNNRLFWVRHTWPEVEAW